jgi:2-amino-4-hydroxy-6-hydroxymethyldihydropteridine diphosphokinase
MSRAFLSLGSNLDDRLAYLRVAGAALGRGPTVALVAASSIYETEPVEVEESQPNYLNCVVELECGIPAIELLRYSQGVEAALGRERRGGPDGLPERAPRTIDVDILLFGGEEIEEPDLTVPHRGVARAFNLAALAELDPDLYIPGYGRVGRLLAGADLGGIRKLEEVGALC